MSVNANNLRRKRSNPSNLWLFSTIAIYAASQGAQAQNSSGANEKSTKSPSPTSISTPLSTPQQGPTAPSVLPAASLIGSATSAGSSTATYDPIAIVNSVNNFYSNSWDKLVWLIGILVALVGVIIPLISTFFQKRQADALREKLENSFDERLNVHVKQLRSEIEGAISSQRNELLAEIKGTEKKLTENIFLRFRSVEAGLDFSVANLSRSENSYAHAMSFYLSSAENYLRIKSSSNNRDGAFRNAVAVSARLEKQAVPKTPKGYMKQKKCLVSSVRHISRIVKFHEKIDSKKKIANFSNDIEIMLKHIGDREKVLEGLKFVDDSESQSTEPNF